MNLYDFIFSEKLKIRIVRHLFFWVCWWLYFGFLHAANPFGKEEISYFRNLPFTLLESVLLLIPHAVYTYILLLFVFPRFILKKKYITALIYFLLLYSLSGFLNLFFVKEINPVVLSALLPAKYLINTQRPGEVIFFMAMMSAFKGGLTIASLAIGVKFIKFWYLKEQKNLQLQKENTEAQLQILTAQVHPHFLFNTLNNIYSNTQTTSPKASKMILELSDLLRYILYEGNKPLVPLQDELKMIQEYINLEKIRYGNKLEVHFLMPSNTTDIYIAPLLLIPFVENCFKHGTSNILERPWVNLSIEMKDTWLIMKLMNSKLKKTTGSPGRNGIGINNVRKRLELLYKDKYDLLVREEEEVFVIDLKMQLVRNEKDEHQKAISPTTIKYKYE